MPSRLHIAIVLIREWFADHPSEEAADAIDLIDMLLKGAKNVPDKLPAAIDDALKSVIGTSAYYAVAKLCDLVRAEHSPKPLEAYLEFANELAVEECGLGYDAAVAIAKAMHNRGMIIPTKE